MLPEILITGTRQIINTKLKPFGGSRLVVVLNNIKPGLFEFKLTRGSWDKVETTAKGENIDNRIINNIIMILH